MHRPTPTKTTRITYPKLPPKTLFVRENAKSQSAAAGPTMRWIDATICARPFVAPSDRLLRMAEEMYIYEAPDEFVLRQCQHIARRMGSTY